MSHSATPDQHGISAELLSGTWFVVRTTLPMWRSWHSPSISYTPLPDGQIVDTVRAERGSQTRLIIGLDTPLARAGAFQWRGVTPLTRWTPSRWEVAAYDAGGAWLVSLFGRTPFTPAGMDICTRTPYVLPDLEGQILSVLRGLPKTAKHLPQLFAPQQTPRASW